MQTTGPLITAACNVLFTSPVAHCVGCDGRTHWYIHTDIIHLHVLRHVMYVLMYAEHQLTMTYFKNGYFHGFI